METQEVVFLYFWNFLIFFVQSVHLGPRWPSEGRDLK